ncbi:MAG TPA: hypothetical protein VGD21_09140 [Lysobacter sp.]
MRSDSTQLDLYRHGDAGMAEAFRKAADAARRSPFETPDRCEERARHYEEQAAQHEARAEGRA